MAPLLNKALQLAANRSKLQTTQHNKEQQSERYLLLKYEPVKNGFSHAK